MKRVTDMTHNQQQLQKQQPQLCVGVSLLCVCVCACVCCALADAKEIWRQFYAQAARTKKVKPMGEG